MRPKRFDPSRVVDNSASPQTPREWDAERKARHAAALKELEAPESIEIGPKGDARNPVNGKASGTRPRRYGYAPDQATPEEQAAHEARVDAILEEYARLTNGVETANMKDVA